MIVQPPGLLFLVAATALAIPSSTAVSWGIPFPFYNTPRPHFFAQQSLHHRGGAKTDNDNMSMDTNRNLNGDDPNRIVEDFIAFLQQKQTQIIQQIHDLEASFGGSQAALFGQDAWGILASDPSAIDETDAADKIGGQTRVMHGGVVVEKGVCNLAIVRQGILTAERAAVLQQRKLLSSSSPSFVLQAGDKYSAATLSIVLHAKHPMVPTLRADVRLFQVQSSRDASKSVTWLAGGADLTPSVLFEADITYFHTCYRDLIAQHQEHLPEGFTYADQKQACDEYLYLPARGEHRGTGGIFFDDLPLTDATLSYVKDLAESWMLSWLPIVQQRQGMEFTEQDRQWQLLRRGRYLEFHLLYDHGAKYGLSKANPRTEYIMVSAPPLVAYEYKHPVEPGSREDELMQVLKKPRDWV